jgi:hypothetical protein
LDGDGSPLTRAEVLIAVRGPGRCERCRRFVALANVGEPRGRQVDEPSASARSTTTA